jgi:hypothetical protein
MVSVGNVWRIEVNSGPYRCTPIVGTVLSIGEVIGSEIGMWDSIPGAGTAPKCYYKLRHYKLRYLD